MKDPIEPHSTKPYPELSGIKSWAEEDRPREKLLLKGKHALSESELIAILLRTGTKEFTAVDIAKEIMRKVNHDLNQLSKMSVADILELGIDGIGETKAITIVAAIELGRRRQSSESKDKYKITSSRDAFEILSPELSDKKIEEFWILLLNRANRVIDKKKVSSGGLTGTVADVRMIFKEAINMQAVSIILCHNHPSGNLTPSAEDIQLTKKMKEGGSMLEIAVLDHLIIADNKFYSFADEGMM